MKCLRISGNVYACSNDSGEDSVGVKQREFSTSTTFSVCVANFFCFFAISGSKTVDVANKT